MNRTHRKSFWSSSRTQCALLLFLILAMALPTLAWEPAGGPSPEWVSASGIPGFYAARDWRNLDATTHGFVGSHQSFYWDQLEPTEGNYQWGLIHNFLNTAQSSGKQGAIGIITFNGRANEGNDTDPPLRVPAFVFAAGAQKILCAGDGAKYPVGDPRRTNPPQFEIPKYWHPVYKTKYENFIAALSNEFDGDPRLEFIQIGVGKFGETQPCDDNDDPCVDAALVADGMSQWDWAGVVQEITAMYDRHFGSTRLLLPNAPTFKTDKGGRRTWSDDAISRGVGLFPAGLMPIQEGVDYRTKPNWDGIGIFDRILTHIEQFEAQTGTESWVPLSQEAYNYMAPTAIDFYWGVLGALRRRIDYITVEHSLFYAGESPRPDFAGFVDTIKWANGYIGKTLAESPSVWVALREAGYRDSWYPQKGNYSWFLYQDDSIAGGRTVATTYRPPRDLVHHLDYDYWVPTEGEAFLIRQEIETNQAFLGPSKEGWICRRTDYGSSNPRMYFKVDDRYTYGGGSPATVTITYFDRGTDTWRLVYDATGNGNQVAGTVTKTNTNTWKKRVFTLNDAFFANRQLGGADFHIDSMSDGNEYIHMVDVDADGGGSTATPTATLDPNITPSATPTPTRTLTPSLTPQVTPTPAVRDIPPLQDTYLDAWDPTNIRGSDHRIRVRTGIFNSLIRFDLASVPSDATVQKATLYLYLDEYEHQTHLQPLVSAYKVKQDWEELQAHWNDRLTSQAWGAPGASSATDREMTASASKVVEANWTWYSWDITALAQDWVWYPTSNKGLILLSDSGRELRFHSQNAGSNQPYLHIEYAAGGGVGPTHTPTATISGTPVATPSADVLEFRGASKDVYIAAGSTTNYENQGLAVKGGNQKKSLLDFNVGAQIPAGSEIVSATLRMTTFPYDDGKGHLTLPIGAYLVYRDWAANQATWYAATGSTSWATAGCDDVPTDRAGTPASVVTVQETSAGTRPDQLVRYDWNVTDIVQAWMDDPAGTSGLALLNLDGAFRDIRFFDSAYQAGSGGEPMHPLLLVQWRPGEPTPTATQDVSKGTINGAVFDDLNVNGVRESGELGVAGATVELWNGAVKVGQQVTAGSGDYSFASLNPGTYTLKLLPPTGWVPSGPSERAIALAGGQIRTEYLGVYERRRAGYVPLVLK